MVTFLGVVLLVLFVPPLLAVLIIAWATLLSIARGK
jgi:hypothetical protein